MDMKLARFFGYSSFGVYFLLLAQEVLAQIATEEAKGGTSGALPDAGTTEITYALFVGGLLLFVVGTLKLISSYRS